MGTFLEIGIRRYRTVRPTPNAQVEAPGQPGSPPWSGGLILRIVGRRERARGRESAKWIEFANVTITGEHRPSRFADVAGLVGWILLCGAAAATGAVASAQAGNFYAQLARPSWAPPAWLFGPVWTVLYLLMGIAAWLVWRECGFRQRGLALTLFLVQLAVNALWTWLFFVWHRGALAFVEIVLLWALILATTVAFRRARVLAGALLWPYLAWVTFAAALTWAIWRGNPALLG